MHQLDLYVFHAINAWCGNWTLDRIVQFEENHNIYKGGVFMLAYCWFWFAPETERREANRRCIVAALLGTLSALVINRLMAGALPFRVRPMLDAASGYHPPTLPIIANMEEWNSFPSDTATFFFALAFGLWRLSRPLGVFATVYTVVWVSLPRLYLGLHYPSDILAGALLGVLVTYGAIGVMVHARDGALAERIVGLLDAAEQRHPQWFYVAALALTFEMMTLFDDVRDLARGTVRFLRFRGYVAAGEEVALFMVGGALLAVAGGVWTILWLRRRTELRSALPRAALAEPQSRQPTTHA